MKSSGWRTSLSRSDLDDALRSWLSEPGSLTRRLQAQCADFRVRLLTQGRQRQSTLSAAGSRRAQVPVRDVLLLCAGEPVIFAHTELSTVTRGRLTHWLRGLGDRSLGTLLFSYPGFVRGRIEYCRLDARQPLFRRAAGFAEVPATLWARRSTHWLGGQAVQVTEVFLPPITRLSA